MIALLLAMQAGAVPAWAPSPVRAFVERRASCNHWAGEEPYDAERRGEIEQAWRVGRCDALARDEAALRRRYARDRRTVALLRRSRDWIE